jgi:hypothetical protein
MGGSPRPLAAALSVGLLFLGVPVGRAAAQTRADCEGGIRFIHEALRDAADPAVRSALSRSLRIAERELGEGEFDECMDAVQDAREAVAGAPPSTTVRRPQEAPEYLQTDVGLPVGLEDAFIPRSGEVEAKFRSIYTRLRRGTGGGGAGGGGDDDEGGGGGGGGRRRGRDALVPGAELEIGLGGGLSATIGTEYRLGNTEDAKSGEFEFGGKWGFLPARDWRPALALSGGVSVPYGYAHSDTVETTLALLASQPLGGISERVPYVHANLLWTHAFNRDEDARLNRFAGALGISLPVSTSTALVLDLVHEQEDDKGRISNLVEVGVRQALPGKIILTAGAGAGFGGSATDFRLLIGLQKQF